VRYELFHSRKQLLLSLGIEGTNLGFNIVIVLLNYGNQNVHANDDDEVG